MNNEQRFNRRWAVLAVVLCAEVMDLLDATVINIAGPSIRRDLGGGTVLLQWLAAGYTLAFAVGLVTGGRLGDIYGRRRMFLVGAAGFTLASLLCAVAPGPATLVACRVLQGLAGAVLIPQGLGLIKAAFPPEQMGAAFGAFGPVMGLSAVCGPILAGFLVDADLFGTGWHMIFGINLPVGLAALLGAVFVLPRNDPADRSATPGLHLDLLGTAMLSTSLLLVIFPLVQGRDLGWPWWAWAMMAAAVPCLWGFQVYQQRLRRTGGSPLVEPSLLAKRRFNAGLIVGLIFFAALMGLTLILSVHLQLGLGFTPLHAGLTQAPWAFGTAVGAVAGHTLSGRFGGRRMLLTGTALLGAGVLALLATLQLAGTSDPARTVSSWQLLPALLVLGIGMGCAMTPYFDLVLAAVDEHEVGSASGTLTAAQQLGGAIGVAALGTAFFAWIPVHGFDLALRRVLWLEVAVVALAGALAFLLPERAREEPAPSAAATDPAAMASTAAGA